MPCCLGGPPFWPHATTIADVNRDGIPDYITANASTGDVDVYMGHGDGSFASPVGYHVGYLPIAVAVGDLNGDGFSDIVVAQGGSYGYWQYSVLLNHGDGTFGVSTYTSSSYALDVALGDLNGDGKLDLVITGNSLIQALLGNGDGTFGTATTYALHGSGQSSTIADVNGDNRPDVVVAEGNPPGADCATVGVFLNNGSGTLGTRTDYCMGTTYANATNVDVADVNHDGVPDLAVSDGNCGFDGGHVTVFLGTGQGSFGSGNQLTDPCTGDVGFMNGTGSGNMDIVSLSNAPVGSRVSVFPGNGDGTFGTRADYSSPIANGTTFAIGDLNRDGKQDVIIADGGTQNNGGYASVFLNITAGTFNPIGGPVTTQETLGGEDQQPCHACWARRFVHGSWVEPVDSEDGNFTEQYGDLMIPGRGFPLAFVRTYNSLAASSNGPLGFGWTHAYDAVLSQDPNTSVVTITQENGSQVTFARTGSGGTATYAPTAPRTIATLALNGDGSWTFVRQANETLKFSSAGLLTSLTDRNGYSTTLGYNVSNQLTTITDPASRALTLGYTGSLLTSVTDPIGRSVQYGYNDGLGNLTDVTDVNGGNTHYIYDTAHHILTVRDPRGNTVTTNHYDASNRVDYQLDALQRRTSFTYAPDGSYTIITDPLLNEVKETYAAGVRMSVTRGFGTSQAATWTYTHDPYTLAVIGITDPNGHSTYRTYDASGNPLTMSDGLGRTTTYEYNSFNEPTVVTDPKGVTTTMTYDASGNLLSTSTPLVGSSPLQYSTTTNTYGDPSHPGDVTAVTDPDSKQWQRSYDTDGDLASATDPVGDKVTSSYNTVGWLQSSVSPRGNVTGGNASQFTTTYSYANPTTGAIDEFGDVRVVTDPLGHTTTTSYDADRNVVSVKDGDGNTTTDQYDAANEKTDVLRADGTTLHTDYNLDGTVKDQLDGAHNTTNYGYDQLARVTSVTDPLQRVTSYTYDGAGNLLTKLDPVSGATCTGTPKVGCTTNGYDAADELTSISYSDGVTPNVTIGYDPDGQRTSMTDGTGSSSWVFDSLHRLTSSTNGAGSTVGYGYDLAGRLTSLTYPGSHTVQRGYDDAGRLTSVSDWLSHTTTFTPDPDSNTTAEAYANQTTATMGFNNADQLTSISDAPTATPNSPFASFTYGRDGNGQVSSVTSTGVPTDNHSYTYTPLNQLQNVDTTSYAYSPADTVTQLVNSTALSYDAADQLTSATPTNGVTVVGTASGGDTGSGKTITLTLPAGIQANDQILLTSTQQGGKTVNTPSGYTQVTSVTSTGSPAANTILYRRTATGGETSVTITYGTKFAKSVVAVVYRGLNPTTPIDGTPSSGTAAASTSVTAPSLTTTGVYDRLTLFGGGVGNASAASWTAPSGMTSEVQKSDQASTSAAIVDQTVPAAGATGTRTATLSTTAQLTAILLALQPARTTYAFDSRGNRTSVTPPSGSSSSFSYDQANRLTAYGSSATYKYDGRGQRMSKTVNSTAESFTWDDAASLPLLLVDATSTSTTDLIYGVGGQPLEEVLSSGSVYYFHSDQIGSTRLLTDTTAAVVATLTYDSYGNLSASSGTVSTPLLYAAQYRDTESGLYYMRARYYDPATLQLLARDPLASTTGEPYSYVRDNPLNGRDPSGLDPTSICNQANSPRDFGLGRVFSPTEPGDPQYGFLYTNCDQNNSVPIHEISPETGAAIIGAPIAGLVCIFGGCEVAATTEAGAAAARWMVVAAAGTIAAVLFKEAGDPGHGRGELPDQNGPLPYRPGVWPFNTPPPSPTPCPAPSPGAPLYEPPAPGYTP